MYDVDPDSSSDPGCPQIRINNPSWVAPCVVQFYQASLGQAGPGGFPLLSTESCVADTTSFTMPHTWQVNHRGEAGGLDINIKSITVGFIHPDVDRSFFMIYKASTATKAVTTQVLGGTFTSSQPNTAVTLSETIPLAVGSPVSFEVLSYLDSTNPSAQPKNNYQLISYITSG